MPVISVSQWVEMDAGLTHFCGLDGSGLAGGLTRVRAVRHGPGKQAGRHEASRC